MANRRELKKAIHEVTASLFMECIMFKEFIPKTDIEAADALLDEILEFQREYLSRVNAYGGRENPKLVKQYFRKLNQDVVKAAQDIFSKINELNK